MSFLSHSLVVQRGFTDGTLGCNGYRRDNKLFVCRRRKCDFNLFPCFRAIDFLWVHPKSVIRWCDC